MIRRLAAATSPTGVVTLVGLLNAVLFALMAFAHWVGWGGPDGLESSGMTPGQVTATSVFVVVVDLVCAFAAVSLVVLTRPLGRRWRYRLGAVLTVSAAVAVVRVAALGDVGRPVTLVDDVLDGAATGLGYVVALVGALLVADLVVAYEAQMRARTAAEVASARQVARLEAQEGVRRRLVADRLHGAVQNRLVLLAAGIDQVVERLEPDRPDDAAALRRIADQLAEVSERDVRALSHELFPTAVDVSVVRAVRTLLDRLPPSVAGALDLGPTYRDLVDHGTDDPIVLPDRLVVVDTVEEALTNALKHGRAHRVRVRLDVERCVAGDAPLWLVGVVRADGRGPSGHVVLGGLERLRSRLAARGGGLHLTGDERGSVLRFDLPLRTAASPEDTLPGDCVP
ncbi:sensor histidine kinase [Cellulomonas triticagri]|uniref:Signal transduction histidine kinase subgroup 3 dimerisation and phosphoacceptor domain-containing protein n=1 Tax=Cellulomonas triticagri TaxID=2483352 RepID=A0A3M2JQF7_9CELL|nr:hypothetical protein [Cellulomonas triticagri]RMI14050.1 hypothetical protein EBM89_01600 [Cellulomonas triticagri]